GKDKEYIVYNKLDQPIMTQDANQRANGQWLFTKYDVFGRVAYTGVHNSTGTRSTMQALANDTVTYGQYVARIPSANNYGGTTVYYDNAAIPHTMAQIFMVNYYDTYVDTDGLSVPAMVLGQPRAVNTKGLATVNKTRVLETNNWIT